jgi:predicted nucleic acid-binding protein
MGFVLDASVAAAWCLRTEKAALAEIAFEQLARDDQAVTPRLFWYEIRNVFIVQERQGRIAAADTTKTLTYLAMLPIRFEEPDSDIALNVARAHRLTVYDASYLALALTLRLPLATLDRALASAARQARVSLLGGSSA